MEFRGQNCKVFLKKKKAMLVDKIQQCKYNKKEMKLKGDLQ